MAMRPLDIKDAVLFLIDVNPTMYPPVDVEFANGTESVARPIDLMVRFAQEKIAQRITRVIQKTKPIVGVMSFGDRRTKNFRSSDFKALNTDKGKEYIKSNDPFRHIYINIPFNNEFDIHLIRDLDDMMTGDGEASTHVDISVAIETAIDYFDREPLIKKQNRSIFLMTNARSETDWEYAADLTKKLYESSVALHVIAFDFHSFRGQPQDIPVTSNVQIQNEVALRQIGKSLSESLDIVDVVDALNVLDEPVLYEHKSLPVATKAFAREFILSIGPRLQGEEEEDNKPDATVRMYIQMQKAVVLEKANKSLKMMSLRGFEVLQEYTEGKQAQSDNGAKRVEAKSTLKSASRHPSDEKKNYRLGKLGKVFESPEDFDESLYTIEIQRRRYYATKKRRRVEETEVLLDNTISQTARPAVNSDEEAENEELEPVPDVADESEDVAYNYGGFLIPVTQEQEETLHLAALKCGMDVMYFMKTENISMHYRLGEVYYVYGRDESVQIFSNFVSALLTTDRCAVVRFVPPVKGRSKFKVKVGILYPVRETLDIGGQVHNREYCYWVQMPFAEDEHSLILPPILKNHLKGEQSEKDERQMALMKSFLEETDLSAGQKGDEPWFDIAQSYNPAIHNLDFVLKHRFLHPQEPLPPISSQALRYFEPPRSISDSLEEKLTSEFKIKRKTVRGKEGAEAGDAAKEAERSALADLTADIPYDELFGP